MDITLEKIDMVKDRTGVTYKEARDALLATDGDVLEAIIFIEENADKKWTETISVKGNEVIDKVKELLKSGNINRIKIKKDDNTILDIPVTAGALSAVVLPQITAIGTAFALMSKCTIEVERENKDPINFNNVINDVLSGLADKAEDVIDDVKDALDKD